MVSIDKSVLYVLSIESSSLLYFPNSKAFILILNSIQHHINYF